MPARRRLVVIGLLAAGISVAWAALASRGGAFSPDGRHLLVQRDADLLIELDAATLRPLARVDLEPAAELLDWCPIP